MSRAGRPRKYNLLESEEELYNLYRSAKSVSLRTRYQVLWLLKQNYTYDHVAHAAGLERSSVQNIVQWYVEEGLAGMQVHSRGGARPRPSRLSPEQADELEETCQDGRFRHSSEIARWLLLTFGVVFSASGLRHCLYRLGLSWKTMRPVHPKRNDELASWWKEFLFFCRIDPFGRSVIFYDEMRLGLLGQSRRAWGRKGERLPQLRQQSYRWMYLALWLDPHSHTIGWTWIPNLKAQTLLEVMRGWQGIRAVVWDRAPSHRAKLLDELPIGRIEIPPYSPDLNPVERIFQEIRRHVEGIVYETVEDKQAAVESFLKSLTTEQIESLTGWEYIQTALKAA